MASFYEPDSFLLDPTSYENDLPSSFLSFSSFADFAPSSPFSLPWDFAKKPAPAPAPHSDASATSSPTALEPFTLIESAFEPTTPAGDVGIFHTAGPSDPPSTSTSYRSSNSSDSWGEDPLTPGLSSRASTESFASTSTIHPQVYKQQYQPFAWDDSVLGGSSSYAQPVLQQAHRTTSNPSLNPNSTRPRVPRPIASMPTLKEDDMSWFDGMDLGSIGSTAQPVSNLETTETSLADEFDWAFADFGNLDVPIESTIFAAFNEEPSEPQLPAQQTGDQTWLPTPISQETDVVPTYDYSAIANMPTFCIDPSTIMAPNAGMEEQPSRPSSAPGLNTEASTTGQMLSVPMPETMTRSLSSDGFVPQRHAPPRDLFSYAPQQIPVGPPAPQPLYTTEPSPSYIHHPRAMPPTPTHSRRLSGNGLSVQIQQPLFSTYIPAANLPPTPQSATFGDFSSQQPRPVQMTRAGTQPLPTTRRLSTSENYGIPANSKMPAHLVRAQAIVQMQEAKEEAHRQEMRRLSASRRVNMQQASVMQPQWQQQQQQQHHQPQPQHPHLQHQPQHLHQQQQIPQPQAQRQQHIMGWEGPSAQTASLPVLTTTPLVTIHPPPAQYAAQAPPTTPHRVHPPPHPAPSSISRPIARLPVSPTKARKVSASPAKRSPSGKKRQAAGAGGFSWGEATFINFTSDDADKLLTGVAPSGSQSKRKREEDALRMGDVLVGGEEMGRERSKRSKSDE